MQWEGKKVGKNGTENHVKGYVGLIGGPIT
jgi:hypothetical protein